MVVASVAGANQRAHAQGFNSGSTGTDGPLNVTADTTLDLPPDGIFNFTTITVSANTTLRFNANPLNTPVYLLATGDVLIEGAIDLSGTLGTATSPGKGGPGGFDGGSPGLAGVLPGDGRGPGGGKAGSNGSSGDAAGAGAYATASIDNKANDGQTYGSPLLVPLVGGSGGGGNPVAGGSGGGGAILIASNTRVTIPEPAFGVVRGILARGFGFFTGGSGGAIRLVAPVVQAGPTALLDVGGERSGAGRVRIDTIDKSQVPVRINPATSLSVGAFMTVFPPNNPRLDIIQAAGTTIAEGTASPVTISLPFGSDPNRTVTVQARNFKATVPIEVVLTPDNGPSVAVKATIDNASANPAVVTVPVTFLVNTPVTVSAWIR